MTFLVRQVFLESKFPAYPPPLHPKKTDDKPPPAKLSVRNTAIKFALDQTVGSAVNTLLFSVVNRSLQEAMADAPRITNPYKAISYWTRAESLDFSRVDFGTVWATALDEFWPIIQAGWKLWPFVSLFNYTVVKTVEGRNLVGSLAGLGWGVYMSLVAAN
jgi:hypothetical protein